MGKIKLTLSYTQTFYGTNTKIAIIKHKVKNQSSIKKSYNFFKKFWDKLFKIIEFLHRNI